MTRREQAEQWADSRPACDPVGLWAPPAVVAELHALWDVADAAEELRECRGDAWTGEVIGGVLDALDAYHAGQDGER